MPVQGDDTQVCCCGAGFVGLDPELKRGRPSLFLRFFVRSPPLDGDEPAGWTGGLEAPVEWPVATGAAAALEESPVDAPTDSHVLAASILCEQSRRVSSCTRYE
jgi:hypothetical protein